MDTLTDSVALASQQDKSIPRHVAIIMDGNGRWAKAQGKSRTAGHRAGSEAVRHVLKFAAKKGIEVISLFAFSSENWNRPKLEVDFLIQLFITGLKRELKAFHKNQVQLHFIGDLAAFPKRLQKAIKDAEDLTRDNTGLKLVVAVNYGGRWDILNAVKKLAQDVKAGKLEPENIQENDFAAYLSLRDLPEPDLMIRTSGELRISNFFLWQLAYSELFFVDSYWPDFNEESFEQALKAYAGRKRRFGKTDEQTK